MVDKGSIDDWGEGLIEVVESTMGDLRLRQVSEDIKKSVAEAITSRILESPILASDNSVYPTVAIDRETQEINMEELDMFKSQLSLFFDPISSSAVGIIDEESGITMDTVFDMEIYNIDVSKEEFLPEGVFDIGIRISSQELPFVAKLEEFFVNSALSISCGKEDSDILYAIVRVGFAECYASLKSLEIDRRGSRNKLQKRFKRLWELISSIENKNYESILRNIA